MDNWEIKKQKGNDEFRRKNYKAAIQLYTEAIQLAPNQDTWFNNLGLCYMNLDQHDLAKENLTKAIDLNPKNIKALKRWSTVNISIGNLTEAKILFERCIEIEPSEPLHQTELSELETLLKLKEETKENYILKNMDKVFELSGKLTLKCKYNKEIKNIFFESAISTCNIDTALNFYKNNFTNDEKTNDNVQYYLSVLYYTDGKYEKSLQIINNLILRSSDANVIEKCKKLRIDWEEIQKEKDKANECYKKNNFSGAIEWYTELLNRANNNKIFNALILANRSLCYYKKKEMFKALSDINDSIKWNNKYWKSYQRRANINISLKNSEQAKADLRRLLEWDPTNRDAIILLDNIQREEKKAKKRDWYKILECNRLSSQEEIRRAFKRLALKWHPDKNNESEEQEIYAERMFKDVNEAYNILSDPRKRTIYDEGEHPDDPNSKFHSKEEQMRTNNFYNGDKTEKRRERSSNYK